MSKLNPLIKPLPVADPNVRLAGGTGAKAAVQKEEALLRRAVMACLLWEDLAYESGMDNADNIARLIPLVEPSKVFNIALEARTIQKLRHVPLFIASEMLKYPKHKLLVGDLLPLIITRADQITDMLAIYWKNGRCKLASQLKKGLAASFFNFDEYQFAKYDRDAAIKLRDVMFLVRPNPYVIPDHSGVRLSTFEFKAQLFKKIADRTLDTPDTWEVALSTGKDKKETWERLIKEDKLGSLAFLRNLRNMKAVDVNSSVIRKGLKNSKSQMLLPLNFLQAAQYAPEYKTDINDMMLRVYKDLPKIPGKSIFVVDLSGSMSSHISMKSNFSRYHVAAALAMLAVEQCEEIELWVTAGNDYRKIHQTKQIKHPSRGFDLIDQILKEVNGLGGGGIFTRQCLEYIEKNTNSVPDRIMIFSDSQDCDTANKTPKPFGKNNYICDVSSHEHGINYKGVFSAEVSGWSENFLTFIAAFEGITNTFEEQ